MWNSKGWELKAFGLLRVEGYNFSTSQLLHLSTFLFTQARLINHSVYLK